MTRYLRLYAAFATFGLISEMNFRLNFVIKLTVELLWLGILVAFYHILFGRTDTIAGWDKASYLFFVGCHYALGGLIESLFLENCTNFAELVRSGDLDFYLLKPIDEQFLVSCRNVDWSTLPNVLQGAAVMLYALSLRGGPWPTASQVVAFLALFACGALMTYSFLLMLCSLSVWLVRNQSLMEMWWLFTTLMRYPREIFATTAWGYPVGWFFTFVVPILLVVSVPAGVMVRALDPYFAALMVAATAAMLVVSRWFFRKALASYRSASS